MRRRTLIELGLAVAGTTVAAGCLGDSATEENEPSVPTFDRPQYSQWIPATAREDESDVLFTQLNWQTVNQLENGEDEEDDLDIIEDVPILGLPLYGSILTPLALFGIAFYPFSNVIIPTDGETVEGITTRETTWADTVLVFAGEYDVSVFETQYAEGFEAVEESNGFTVFEGVDEFTADLAYTVSEETVVVGMTPSEDDEYAPSEELSAALNRAVSERDRVVDTDDGQWLFETTGEADMLFGAWQTEDLLAALDPEANQENGAAGDEPDVDETNPVFADVESVINTLSFDIESGEISGLEARFAGIYPNGAAPSEAEVRDHLIGEEDILHEIIIDEPRVHATATVDSVE